MRKPPWQYFLEEDEGIADMYWIPNRKHVCLTKYRYFEDPYTYNFWLKEWEESYTFTTSKFTPITEEQTNNYILVSKLVM